MVGVVLAGGIAIFLAGLAIGIVLANAFLLRDAERRARLIGKARALLGAGKTQGQPDGGP